VVRRAAALAFLAGLVVPGAASAQDALPGGRAIVAAAAIAPDTHLFAEPVTAHVDLVLDPAQLDPDRIRVRMRLAPYKLIGPVRETRRDVNDLVHVRYTATIRCLEVECLAPRFETVLGEQEAGRAERHTYRFPPAEIHYEEDNGREQLLFRRGFPALQVVSRLNTAQLDAADQPGATRSAYTASLEPPAPTYRMSPERIAAVALAVAALLFLFPAALAGRFLLRRWRATRRPRALSPLERALVLVEWTGRQADGEHDRRKALEALADALEREGASPLAEAARTFAWGEESPGRERAHDLAAEARTAVARRGNGRPA
jgi:hypothetical protein